MLYHITEWLRAEGIRFPGSALFQFITSRALIAILLSLFISLVSGRRFIRLLQRKQIGESVRDLGLAGEQQKKGTPTMGGLIIIAAILIPTLLLADLTKVYVRLMIFCTIWLGAIGFLDDYFKIRAKRIAQQKGIPYKKGDDDGLAGKFKIFGQVMLGIVVGATLYFNQNVKIWREYVGTNKEFIANVDTTNTGQFKTAFINGKKRVFVEAKSFVTTIPFVKNHEFNYSRLLPSSWRDYTWILYILVTIFIITAVSNGANITDGLDGLATGTSAIICAVFGIFAYASGSLLIADYLNIMYIPNLGELSIFIGALVGACVGFLWYNSFPAQVFMGDTGSLTLGGIIAALAFIVHKELLIPIICGVFLVENLSVMLQVSYFKYTKKKYGEGRRIFLMSPLHHHYQKKGYHEAKIVTRFWIVTILCAIISIVTLKIR
ncbi:phospho-N-acetylmuramoyl-pentapeptide-transferase [Flavisolibacter nicotianae]|uniref:phospho-N-acetylmuramoyl-pentapeptide- transferase n=1 Tax=Flavisolibacter nicotianae TaxID=2364882 RepID=UPI000EAC3598|nr:phospho-N-acetylmuramoyl-pentapeptide-transferase [Flavisolibacter nicotianae]